MASFMDCRARRSPDVNAGKEKQPDNIDKVPIPGGGLKTEMLLRREMAGKGTEEAYDEKNRTDDDMEPMEARGHEKGRAIDVAAAMAAEGKGCVGVFIGLNRGEQQPQQNGESKSRDETPAV